MLLQLAVNGLVAGCISALLAGAFSILFTASRFFVFTFGASYALAAYMLLAGKGEAPVWVLSIVGIAAATALGAGLETGIYGPIRNRGNQPLQLMLASIGIYTIFQSSLSLAFGDATRTIRPAAVSKIIELLGARVTTVQIAIALTAIALITGIRLFFLRTDYGLQLRAVLDDVDLARAMGLDIKRIVLLGVMLGSAIAGAAGVLTSFDIDLTPTMGFGALLIGVVGAVIGGIHSARAAACGGFAVGLLKHIAVWKLPTEWQDGIVFVLLLFVLLLSPRGLFVTRSERAA